MINGVLVRRFSPDGGLWERLIVAWQGLRGGYRSTNLLFSAEGLEMLTSRHPRPLAMIPSILRSDADIVASVNWLFPSAYYVHLARRLKRFRLVGVVYSLLLRDTWNPPYASSSVGVAPSSGRSRRRTMK